LPAACFPSQHGYHCSKESKYGRPRFTAPSAHRAERLAGRRAACRHLPAEQIHRPAGPARPPADHSNAWLLCQPSPNTSSATSQLLWLLSSVAKALLPHTCTALLTSLEMKRTCNLGAGGAGCLAASLAARGSLLAGRLPAQPRAGSAGRAGGAELPPPKPLAGCHARLPRRMQLATCSCSSQLAACSSAWPGDPPRHVHGEEPPDDDAPNHVGQPAEQRKEHDLADLRKQARRKQHGSAMASAPRWPTPTGRPTHRALRARCLLVCQVTG
jgi:hypothetical protein